MAIEEEKEPDPMQLSCVWQYGRHIYVHLYDNNMGSVHLLEDQSTVPAVYGRGHVIPLEMARPQVEKLIRLLQQALETPPED